MHQPHITAAHHLRVGCREFRHQPGRRGRESLGLVDAVVAVAPGCLRRHVGLRVARDLLKCVVAGVEHRVRAVPLGRCEARHVVGVEQIGLAAAGAGHPLPAQVVAGQVAIQQVAVQPFGAGPPVPLADVHHIARQPHPGMVVQVAGGVQRAHGGVDGRHAGAGSQQVGRQRVGIGGIGQHTLMQRLEDRRTPVLPDVLKVLAPAQLEDEQVLHLERLARRHGSNDFGQGQEAVRDVRREPCRRTAERVAAARVLARTHGRECRVRGRHRRGERQGHGGFRALRRGNRVVRGDGHQDSNNSQYRCKNDSPTLSHDFV